MYEVKARPDNEAKDYFSAKQIIQKAFSGFKYWKELSPRGNENCSMTD